MPSPNFSKPSSGAVSTSAPAPQVRTSTSAVILAIVVLNTLGIVLLFFKLDWDVRQISAEIGLVRDAVKAEKVVRERAMIEEEDATAVEGEPMEEGDYRVIAESADGKVQLLGKGDCPAVYSVSGPRRLEEVEVRADEYNLGYQEAADVPEAEDLGSVVIQEGSYDTSLTSVAHLPECSVTTLVNL